MTTAPNTPPNTEPADDPPTDRNSIQRAKKLRVLLLADDNPTHAETVLDHIGALRRSRHAVSHFNPVGAKVADLQLAKFDVLVVHWSIVVTWDSYLAPNLRRQIRRFGGLKIQFIQDEYRWIDVVAAMLNELGIDVLFSVLPPAAADKVYGGRLQRTDVVTTLTGFVPDRLVGLQVPPLTERQIDIGYRGRQLPFWTGRLTQEKVWIGAGVLERAERYELRCDISWNEESRIYGEGWMSFLSSCKAVLGTPSGASIADFDGAVERSVKAYLARNPSAGFDEVAAKVLAPYEGNVEIDVISPRVFEAAATRTALILFPGRYSGILKPLVHYIPLERDFSNLGEVADRVRDTEYLTGLVDTAYQDLIASGAYGYRSFVRDFERIIDRRIADRSDPRGSSLRDRIWKRFSPDRA